MLRLVTAALLLLSASTFAQSAEKDEHQLPTLARAKSNIGEWVWIPSAATMCRDGSSTGIGVNLNSASNKVVLYLKGGNACYRSPCCVQLALCPASGLFPVQWKALCLGSHHIRSCRHFDNLLSLHDNTDYIHPIVYCSSPNRSAEERNRVIAAVAAMIPASTRLSLVSFSRAASIIRGRVGVSYILTELAFAFMAFTSFQAFGLLLLRLCIDC